MKNKRKEINVRLNYYIKNSLYEMRLSAYLIESNPLSNSSRVNPTFQLSGFTGSSSVLLLTKNTHFLFVDSRYLEQAFNEISETGCTDISIAQLNDASDPLLWIIQNLQSGQILGLDGTMYSMSKYNFMKTYLKHSGIILNNNIAISKIFPPIYNEECAVHQSVYEHTFSQEITSRLSKIESARVNLRKVGATANFISNYEDIAWLLNLRGSDIKNIPIFISQLFFDFNQVILFANELKFCHELILSLQEEQIFLKSNKLLSTFLSTLPKNTVLLINPDSTSINHLSILKKNIKLIIDRPSYIEIARSFKSRKELFYIKKAMELDGIAMCNFMSWLDKALLSDNLTELCISKKMLEIRSNLSNFISLSFDSIVAFNENASMPHYKPNKKNNSKIVGNGLLLIDSGSQYLFGTTDITRTVGVGIVNSKQKIDFTLVLKSMIALSMAKFPLGISLPNLDSIARYIIWKNCIDYGHSTGHGIGFFLNVHEKPFNLSYRIDNGSKMKTQPGLVISNEPGIYRTGKWGVRIENVMCSYMHESNEFGNFLGFETLTLCPISLLCVDFNLLEKDEIQWINSYHESIKKQLLPILTGKTANWLIENTQPIK